MAQNTKAVKKEDIAYTSASTAENQIESENVHTSPPTNPAPITAMVCPMFKTSPALTNIFLAKCVIDQNRKSTVKAADNTLNMLTQKATCSTLSPAKRENIRPINKKNGAPGGCGTSSL